MNVSIQADRTGIRIGIRTDACARIKVSTDDRLRTALQVCRSGSPKAALQSMNPICSITADHDQRISTLRPRPAA